MTDPIPPAPPTPPTPPAGPEAVRRGRRAAWLLFAGVMVPYFLLVVVARGRIDDLVGVILATPVVGLVAAVVVTFALPRESRKTFWLHGLLCMLAGALLWGLGCTVALTRSL
jgi:hypothetical protein